MTRLYFFFLRRTRKRFKDILRDDFEGSGCCKKVKFGLIAVFRIVPRANLSFPDYARNICNQVKPVKLASQRILRATQAGVSRNWWMMT